jgi:hypothetical protein
MSTDWSHFATPEQTRRAKGIDKAPNYGIAQLPVGDVRKIQDLTVVHEPVEGNDAHTHVFGLADDDNSELLTQQRADLYVACGRDWLIPPGTPIAS